MNTPKPDKTIDQLFEKFLADQEARLSPKTYDKYEGIIHLYRSYLESYWPDHSGKESDAITKARGTYCGTFGAEEIASGFSEFLDYFMPRKVIAGNETMKAAGTVIKKLAKWLVEKGYTEDDESIREMVGETARDLPASQKLLDRLDDWLAEIEPEEYEREVEGHFRISRVEPGQLWLEPILSGEREDRPDPGPREGYAGLQGGLGRRLRGRGRRPKAGGWSRSGTSRRKDRRGPEGGSAPNKWPEPNVRVTSRKVACPRPRDRTASWWTSPGCEEETRGLTVRTRPRSSGRAPPRLPCRAGGPLGSSAAGGSGSGRATGPGGGPAGRESRC